MSCVDTTSVPAVGGLPARSLEAVVSLLHSLQKSQDVDDVARRALLTVSGQLLVQRAALFVTVEDELSLRAVIGASRESLMAQRLRFPSDAIARIERPGDAVLELNEVCPTLSGEVLDRFDRVARLDDGTQMVGVLLLGGWLGRTELTDADRQLLGTLGVVIGTTLRRVETHQQLSLARQRLEEAHQVRKGVMDHVSHEFNTPLMVIKSVGQLLRQAKDGEVGELLDMHDEAVARFEELVTSILDVAREAEGKSTRRPMRVDDFCDEIVTPWAFHHSLHCTRVEAAEATNGIVEVDSIRIEAILDALYRNALDAALDARAVPWINVYVVPGGWWETQDHTGRLPHYASLTSSPEEESDSLGIVVPSTDGGDDFELVVEMIDTGRGIPEGEVQGVLEPFAIASNSPKLGVASAGLGLANALRQANELDARLVLRSQAGRGTVVALILPVHRPGS